MSAVYGSGDVWRVIGHRERGHAGSGTGRWEETASADQLPSSKELKRAREG
jgi:hypothetical protein